jgi:hypothetical protein
MSTVAGSLKCPSSALFCWKIALPLKEILPRDHGKSTEFSKIKWCGNAVINVDIEDYWFTRGLSHLAWVVTAYLIAATVAAPL